MDFRTDVEWDRWKISMVWPHFDWDTRLLSHWGLLICRCLISSGMDSYNMYSLYPYACHNCWRLYIHSDLLQVIVNKKVMVRKTCYLFSLVTTWSDFYTRVKTQMAMGARSFSKDWFFKIKLYGRHLCSQLFYFASRFWTCVWLQVKMNEILYRIYKSNGFCCFPPILFFIWNISIGSLSTSHQPS